MTPLPKRKLSTKRQGDRRSHFHLSLAALIKCPNCHQPYLPHRICPHCGYYNKRLIKAPNQPKKKSPQ